MRITFNTDPMLKATFQVPDFDDWVEVPVVGWDGLGRAVVATPSGHTEPAADLPGFVEIEAHPEGILSGRHVSWMPEKEWSAKRRQEKRERMAQETGLNKHEQ